MAGARQSTKPETNKRYKNFKVSSLKKMMKYLINTSGKQGWMKG
jgi:hypothetical protein